MNARRPGVALVALTIGLLLGPAGAAMADGALPPPPSGSGDGGSTSSTSPTVTQSYDSPSTDSAPAVHCTVYANGAGMGSYCATLTGGGAAQTLRERFAKQEFQRCRYRDVPPTWLVRPNDNPSQGRYMVQICIEGVDWDTVSGGSNRNININVVWVPFSQDVADVHNPVNDYIWGLFSGDAQLPVPMIVTQPATPVVGEPTYFTMRWVNPATRDLVAKGPYADDPQGGPYQEVHLPNGIVMTARGDGITVDPNQTDMSPVDCAPGTPYDPQAGPGDQPAGACSIDFPRSSASAARLEDPSDPMPDRVRTNDSYYLAITVHWDIKYGRGTADNTLGNGFDMVIHQELPVWEVQAPNQPPAVAIH